MSTATLPAFGCGVEDGFELVPFGTDGVRFVDALVVHAQLLAVARRTALNLPLESPVVAQLLEHHRPRSPHEPSVVTIAWVPPRVRLQDASPLCGGCDRPVDQDGAPGRAPVWPCSTYQRLMAALCAEPAGLWAVVCAAGSRAVDQRPGRRARRADASPPDGAAVGPVVVSIEVAK